MTDNTDARPEPVAYVPLTADDLWRNHEVMTINGESAGLSMDVLLKLARAIERLINERAGRGT